MNISAPGQGKSALQVYPKMFGAPCTYTIHMYMYIYMYIVCGDTNVVAKN